MIRIHLTGGETVDTHLHTFEQASAAKAANIGIMVGGPRDVADATLGGLDEPAFVKPRRTIQPEAIDSIEEVPA